MKGYSVFIDQHFAAICCSCFIEKWYGIKKGKGLSDRKIQFLVEVRIFVLLDTMEAYRK